MVTLVGPDDGDSAAPESVALDGEAFTVCVLPGDVTDSATVVPGAGATASAPL